MQNRNGKYALITGASKGLGKSLAKVFFNGGYNLILSGRDAAALEELKKEAKDRQTIVIPGDLRQESTIQQLSEAADKTNLEILINNAGMNLAKRFEDLTPEEYSTILETDFIAPIKLSHAIYPVFKRNGGGVIVNIGAMDGLRAFGENKTIYTASKFGLKGFTDSLKFESKKDGIRVVGVYVAGMNTPMNAPFYQDAAQREKLIDPDEAAEIIFEVSKIRKSLSVEDITIGRLRY